MSAKQEKEGGAWETVKTIFYALLIAGLFRTLFYQPFWIPTGSMKDTLLIGDFLFVNKMAYGYSYASCPALRFIGLDADKVCAVIDGDNTRILGGEPERGDVVVFRHPVTGTDYIKRLIGVPGDTVQMKDGLIYLNGAALPQEPIDDFVEPNTPQGPQRVTPACMSIASGGTECIKRRFTETLPDGQTYNVLNIADIGGARSPDQTGVFRVPEGHYFFIGDNRDNSLDSRFKQSERGVGFVPYEDIIGRAERIIFSAEGRSIFFFWTWRSDRFFKAVK